MLLSDGMNGRVPQIWLFMGLFLLLGLVADSGVRFYYAYPALGVLCMGRALYFYKLRCKYNRRNRTMVLTETQRIERDSVNKESDLQQRENSLTICGRTRSGLVQCLFLHHAITHRSGKDIGTAVAGIIYVPVWTLHQIAASKKIISCPKIRRKIDHPGKYAV
jgi:hypothetical protein